MRLFIDRATTAVPSFTITDQNALAVAQVCHRLDGIPLSIELAAARVKALPVEKIHERLDDRFRLLTGGSRTALPRQQTLRALIDWSYDLLPESERALLRAVSVFAGGWTLEAAEAVCSGVQAFGRSGVQEEEGVQEKGIPSALNARTPECLNALSPDDVLDLLASLVEKSLVDYEEQQGEARYRLLETVRQYARDRLLESGEGETVRDRHLRFFLRLAEEAEPHLETGAELAAWLQRLEAEHDNLRAALTWSQTAAESGERGLRLAGAIWRFWPRRGHAREGREWLEAALQRSGAASSSLRAKALLGASSLAAEQGDYAAARSLGVASLAMFQELGDKTGIAAVLAGNLTYVVRVTGDADAWRSLHEAQSALPRELGNKEDVVQSFSGLIEEARERGDCAAANSLFEEGLTLARQRGDVMAIVRLLGRGMALAREQGDAVAEHTRYKQALALRREVGSERNKVEVAEALEDLGHLALSQADYEEARSLFEETLATYKALGIEGDRDLHVLLYLARTALCQGDLEAARAVAEELLRLGREAGRRGAIGQSLRELGLVALKQGDQAVALSMARESLVLWREMENKWGVAESLENFAHLAVAQGQPARAARLFGAIEAAREVIKVPLRPFERAAHDQGVMMAQASLDAGEFAAAWAEGRAMTTEEAISYALEARAPQGAGNRSEATQGGGGAGTPGP